jgi:hypothetical protein
MAAVLEFISRWAIPTAAASGLIISSMYNVEAGHRAVIFDRLSGNSRWERRHNYVLNILKNQTAINENDAESQGFLIIAIM